MIPYRLRPRILAPSKLGIPQTCFSLFNVIVVGIIDCDDMMREGVSHPLAPWVLVSLVSRAEPLK